MANPTEKYINTAAKSTVNKLRFVRNTPPQYGDRKHQLYANRTRTFVKERAYLASDYVKAKVQGLVLGDFYRYLTTNIRLSDLANQTASGTHNADDTKVILFDEPSITYFPIGAKVQTMGNTWICTNPSNMSTVKPTSVIQRCNTAYCLYDYYGNIIAEPIVVEKPSMASNDNEVPRNIDLLDGYYNVTCQLNENTKDLDQNSRLILGKYAYHITGFSDFIQEYTGDYDSVHLLRFSIRIEEPKENDDMVNHIAGGRYSVFGAEITGDNQVPVGGVTHLQAHFVKGNKDYATSIAPTDEHPISWQWMSSEPEICSVSEDGEVVGLRPGSAKITATMAQNTSITASCEIAVNEVSPSNAVRFTSVVPAEIEQYDEVTIEAGYFENGMLTDLPITFTLDGANEINYIAKISDNSIAITCFGADDKPLVLTAYCNGYEQTVTIDLVGY